MNRRLVMSALAGIALPALLVAGPPATAAPDDQPDGNGPGTWSVTAAGPDTWRVAWQAPERLPVTTDRPTIVAAEDLGGLPVGTPLGVPTVAEDGRTVEVTVTSATEPSPDSLDVMLSGELLDEGTTVARTVPTPDRWTPPDQPLLGVDPGTAGTLPTVSSDYELPGISVPRMAAEVEMVGHVVEPAPEAADPIAPAGAVPARTAQLLLQPGDRPDGMALAVRRQAGPRTQPARLRLHPATAGRPGLRHRLHRRQRHQRPGRQPRRRRGGGAVPAGAGTPGPVGRLGRRRHPAGRPRQRGARRPQPGRGGRLPGLPGDPADRSLPGRRPGAHRSDGLRPADHAVRPHRDGAALLRRRRDGPAGAGVHRPGTPPGRGRHRAQELGVRGRRQPQLLQHRVDPAAGSGSRVRRLGRQGRRLRPRRRDAADGRTAAPGRQGVRRGRGAPLRRRRPGVPADVRRLRGPRRVHGTCRGAQPRGRR